MKALRTFVALEVPDQVRSAISLWMKEVAPHLEGAGAGLVKKGDLHITLRFLGETPAEVVPDLSEGLARVADGCHPFSVVLSGVGVFPPRGAPCVLWAGVRPSPELLGIQASVERKVVEFGWEADGRPFHPHVSLARLRTGRPLPGLSHLLSDTYPEWGSFTALGIVLFQSRLTPSGPVYTPLSRFFFKL